MIGALGAIPVAGAIQVVVRRLARPPPSEDPRSARAAALGGRPAVLSAPAAPEEARGVARYRELFANDHAAALFVWSIVARLPSGMAALALVLLVRGGGASYGEAGLVAAAYGDRRRGRRSVRGPPGRSSRREARAAAPDGAVPVPLRDRRGSRRGRRADRGDRGRSCGRRTDDAARLVGAPLDLADRGGGGRRQDGVRARRGAAGGDLRRRAAARRGARSGRPGRRRSSARRSWQRSGRSCSRGSRRCALPCPRRSTTAPGSVPCRPSASARLRSCASASASASVRSRSPCRRSPRRRATAPSPASRSPASRPARSSGGLVAGLRPTRDERRRIVVGTFCPRGADGTAARSRRRSG